MNKTWKLKVAGILCIISGTVQLLVAFGAFWVQYGIIIDIQFPLEDALMPCIFCILFFLSSLLAIGGGVNIMQRDKKSGLIWAGAIAASLPLFIPWFPVSLYFISTFSGRTNREVYAANGLLVTGLLGILSLILVGRYEQGYRRIVSENWVKINRRWIALNTKWMPKVAGVLDLVSAGYLLLFGMFWGFAVMFSETLHDEEVILAVISVISFFLCAFLAFVGGEHNLRRASWYMAMVGSIAAFFPFVLLPILFLFFFLSGLNLSTRVDTPCRVTSNSYRFSEIIFVDRPSGASGNSGGNSWNSCHRFYSAI